MIDNHALTRTNPKGQPFVGRCLKCGKDNLPPSAVKEECPNPSGITESQAVRTRAGRLTYHIMNKITERQELDTALYNRVYEGVLTGLKTAEDAGCMVCPNNDQAFWSRYVELPRPAKRAILAVMQEIKK